MPQVVLPSRTSVRLYACTSFASAKLLLNGNKKKHAIPHKIILLLFENNITMYVLHFIYYVDYELKQLLLFVVFSH